MHTLRAVHRLLTLIPWNGRRRQGRALNRTEEKFRWRQTHFGAAFRGGARFRILDLPNRESISPIKYSRLRRSDIRERKRKAVDNEKHFRRYRVLSSAMTSYIPTVYSSEVLAPFPLSLFFLSVSLFFRNQPQFFRSAFRRCWHVDCLQRACEATRLLGRSTIHTFIPKNNFKLKMSKSGRVYRAYEWTRAGYTGHFVNKHQRARNEFSLGNSRRAIVLVPRFCAHSFLTLTKN